MIQTLKNAWQIPEMRKKIFYTIMLLVVFRFGAAIPVPFMSADAMRELVAASGDGSFIALMDAFSGGAFANATIFAMSIAPYINASIIMQLLTVAVPALERLSKEGNEGRKKINKYTRYFAVILGFLQAAGLYMALSFAITTPGPLAFFVMTLTFTAGTAFLMWLGEQIQEHGIGNGISLLIFAGIVSTGPAMIADIAANFGVHLGPVSLALWIIGAILLVAAVVFMNDSERRLQVQYAKRVVGRKMYGGQSSHIPIKMLAAGVLPIIFAMSILAFPSTIAALFGQTADTATGFVGWMLTTFTMTSWTYVIIYFLLVIFFTYFYTSIQFPTNDIAINMKKQGGFMPGIRPGKPTADHIIKILTRITFAGAVFLGIIAVLPIVLSMFFPFSLGIGGTSLLIAVSVALETSKQLESNMVQRNYKGFL